MCVRQTLNILLLKKRKSGVIKFPVSTCAKLQATKQKHPLVLVSKQKVCRNEKSGVSNTFLKLSASSQRNLTHFPSVDD